MNIPTIETPHQIARQTVIRQGHLFVEAAYLDVWACRWCGCTPEDHLTASGRLCCLTSPYPDCEWEPADDFSVTDYLRERDYEHLYRL